MKELKKYRVKHAYATYRVGDIITPQGMLRDELMMCGRIEPYVEPEPEPAPETAPAIEPEPDVEPEPAIGPTPVEAAVEPEPETAAAAEPRKRRRGRQRYEV